MAPPRLTGSNLPAAGLLDLPSMIAERGWSPEVVAGLLRCRVAGLGSPVPRPLALAEAPVHIGVDQAGWTGAGAAVSGRSSDAAHLGLLGFGVGL